MINPMESMYAVQFMNMCEIYNEGNPMNATEEQKQKFISNLKEIHSKGFYLAVNKKREWRISDKNPENLTKQIEIFDQLVDSMFQLI